MTDVRALATLWLGLALIATLPSIWLQVSTALSEIVVGTAAQLIISAVIGTAVLGTDESRIKFSAAPPAYVPLGRAAMLAPCPILVVNNP